MKPRLAAKKFMEKIWTGDFKFYAVPDDTEASDLSEAQVNALSASIPDEMNPTVYIQLAPGESLVIDEQILAVTEDELEGRDGGEEDEDEEEEDDE